MDRNGQTYGLPHVNFKSTKAIIESTPNLDEGMTAYATDTNQFGSYDGATWTWGQGGGGLTYNNSTITTANLSCAEGNVYNCTIAGLTANRNAVLPAPSAAGKTIRINILDGDATYALILIGDTGITINGGSSATEWSRLFIAGETVTLESTSTSNWQVIEDGRIPCKGLIQRNAAQSINNNTNTYVQFDTTVTDVGGIVDIANYRLVLRRAGTYQFMGFTSILNLEDQEYVLCRIHEDGVAIANGKNTLSAGTTNETLSAFAAKIKSCNAANYYELEMRHLEGAAQNTGTGNGNEPWLSAEEKL